MFQLRVLTSTPKFNYRLTKRLARKLVKNHIEARYFKNSLGKPLLILSMVWVAMIVFAGICISYFA